ncbi:sensor histidine kinase [Cellulomonas humilata]|uniref:histidine kinase n=1 Tax=Cellulomonas humilata TaxID=144055 RepID=A0ABU0ECT2_9CELL|nr:sensor histidine kinase [Cellulomonas humilata]MDQ0373078.1 signal transduction histidine kinase [Cellulomonas humilata]
MTPAPAPWSGPPWGRGRWGWVAVPAAFLGLVTVLGAAGAGWWHPQARAFDALAVLLLLLAPAAIVLVVRGGRAAVVGTVLAVVGPTTFVALGYEPGPAFVPLGFVVVALGVTRQRVLSLAAGTAGALAVTVLAIGPDTPTLVYATVTVAGLAVAMLLGEGARGRAERMQALRAARASRQESAVAAERLRIARELHDVLAHSLSGITVQAGVGLHLMDREPEAARRALTEIREASRDALDEVREVLGVLRADGEAPREPAGAPGPRSVTELLVRARADGLTVDDEGVAEAATQVPDPLAGVVHRTLQEALTNVRRHAPGASVQVRLTVNDRIVLEVVDDGPGAAEVVDGYGLRGMRERAQSVGGTLVAASGPTGFQVRLELPRGDR